MAYTLDRKRQVIDALCTVTVGRGVPGTQPAEPVGISSRLADGCVTGCPISSSVDHDPALDLRPRQ